MPSRSVATLVLLACFGFSTGALAQRCQKANPQLPKPVLMGEIDDGAKGVHFEWSSWTHGNSAPWGIVNSICNIGVASIIISWPKASIYTSAYSPLPAGKSIHNSFMVQSEPTAQAAPIIYGFYRGKAAAEVYDGVARNAGASSLSSDLFATVRAPDRGEIAVEEVGFAFTSWRRTDGGLVLTIQAKTTEALTVHLAISSRNNLNLQQAFSRIGVKSFVRNFSDMARDAPDQKELFERDYVILEPMAGWNARQFLVFPSIPASVPYEVEVEVAKIAILSRRYEPLVFANISLLSLLSR